jgi:hypothetical protein
LRRITALAVTIALALVWTAQANSDDRTKVHVIIDPSPEGATVHFTFDRPVQAFRLGYPWDAGIRDRTWKIATQGIMRDGTLVAAESGAPFDEFAVQVQTWNERTDATYPCLFRVGAHGLTFYAAYFVGIEADFETTIEIAPARDRIVEGFPRGGRSWRVDTTVQGDAAHRYIYVGKRGDVVTTTWARFVLPPGRTPGLIKRIRENVDGMMRFYRHKLARPMQNKPLIVLAANPAAPEAALQGDVTYGPAVALRVFGDRWGTIDQSSMITDHYIAHETAHFWNSGTARAAGNAPPAWLWEGSAELMALAARVAVTGRLTSQGRREHIEQALNDCVDQLRAGRFTGVRTGATYVCGETLFWLAEAAERTRSNGRSDIFSIWRRILDRAETNGGAYTLDHVLAFAAPTDQIRKAFALFLSEDSVERWANLPALTNPLGIEMTMGPPDATTLRHDMIAHLLNLYCGKGPRGMSREADHLKLDTGDRCGPLSGDPEVDTLNGHSLYADLATAHAALNEACRTNGNVTLSRIGKPDTFTVACTKPLPQPPPTFRILRTP